MAKSWPAAKARAYSSAYRGKYRWDTSSSDGVMGMEIGRTLVNACAVVLKVALYAVVVIFGAVIGAIIQARP